MEPEICERCGSLTGKAGPADDSIYWLDGEIGPLCPDCNDQLRKEVLEDSGTAAEIEKLRRAAPIIEERDRQDEKWGPQNHALPTWLTILTEEVGELAASILCHRFGNDDHPELDWRKEAIQVAAVALSMTEQYKAAQRREESDE